MKAYEVPKGEAEIKRGRVMMAVEGAQERVEKIAAYLKTIGYPSTNCSERGDKDGDIVEFFMIDRADKADFLAGYNSAR